jgi:MoaA/NifB/PqqE/SkfB family radical SAM enzyme
MDKRRFGHIEVPLKRVHIELTNVCDFDCLFCPKSVMKRPFGYMDTDLARKIIDEIGENGICEKVTFHVMGEPTMHPRFFDILGYAMDKRVKVGLTTNGSSLGGEKGKRLLDYPLHQIDVSLQTPDAESFKLRKSRVLSFDSYLRGILRFFHSYKAKWPGTTFKFRFLNTSFRKKGMERKAGRVSVISSTEELRSTFQYWASSIYDILAVGQEERNLALKRIDSLVSYKWNVVEVCPGVYFETYVMEDWGNAFDDTKVRDAWGGYCFGMRDHFGILYNGDVTLCCVDFDGKTAVGNLNYASLKEILSSNEVGRIVKGFRRLQLVHPYCRHCLGSRTFASWLLKPILSATVLKALKPFFYKRTRLYQ